VVCFRFLYYFKTNSPQAKPQGVVPLEYYACSDYSSNVLLELKKELFSTRSTQFVLTVENELDKSSWITELSQRCNSHPIFGVSLVELQKLDPQRLPPVLDYCIDQLMTVGPKTEGIFRLSGAQEEVDRLCAAFSSHLEVNLERESPHVVAGVLKTVFRQLPVPLLTYDLHDVFCRAGQIKNRSEMISELQTCILLLPQVHQDVLELLLSLLELIDTSRDRTKVKKKKERISVVFG
jgi:Rac GTPase-activating protein 1